MKSVVGLLLMFCEESEFIPSLIIFCFTLQLINEQYPLPTSDRLGSISFFFFFFFDGPPIGLENPFLSQNEYMHTFELLALELLVH